MQLRYMSNTLVEAEQIYLIMLRLRKILAKKNDAEGVVFLLGKICLSLKKLSYFRHIIAFGFDGGFESGIGNVFCERYDCVFVFERHLDKRYSVHF